MTDEAPKPTSFYPGPALADYLTLLGPRGRREGVSRVIERMVARYAYVVRGSLPEWSLPDWMVVVEGLRGHDLGSVPGLQSLGLVIQAIVEHKKSGSGAATSNFAYLAKRMPPAGLAAVAELVEGYWRRHDRLDAPTLKEWLQAFPAPGFQAAQEQ